MTPRTRHRTLDRECVLWVLRQHFPGASPQQLAEAATAIRALPDEWEEIPIALRAVGSAHGAVPRVRIFRERVKPTHSAASP